MAKRTRVRTPACAKKPVRAAKPVRAKRTRARKASARKPRNAKPVRAIESRRIQMTPALYDNVRYRFEHTSEGLASMAADLGCTPETVRNIAMREGWVRYRPPARDLSPAARLAAQVEAMTAALHPPLEGEGRSPEPTGAREARPDDLLREGERGGVSDRERSPPPASRRSASAGDPRSSRGQALPPPGGGEENDDPPAVATSFEEMHRVVLTELASVKAMRARMRETPQCPADAEKTARTLNSLMTILRGIQQLQCSAPAQPETNHHDDYDDLPADIDEFREKLARRIEAFMESRPDEGDAAQAPAARPDAS